MHSNFKAFLYLVAGTAVAVTSIAIYSFREVEDGIEVTSEKNTRIAHTWYAPELPKTLSFAGEKVPLDRQEIREQLDRELLYNTYNQYSTIYILKLSARYFPQIVPILKANGIPEDFKYLCVAESALQNQTSRAGAVGFWQFMPGTAPQYGLEVGDEVDERYHVVKSTEAACKYFKQAYAKFGSWTAAAASYNMGQGGYNSFSDFQKMDNYYDLMLPEETMRYVFRILTFKLLMTEPAKYGYNITKHDTYHPIATRTETVTESIPSLAQFALDRGTTYRAVKQLNPWLRDRKLTVKKGKSYDITLPAK